MRVLLVTGIYPPDVGGPATHAADMTAELRARGHHVTVVTLTDQRRTVVRDDVVRFPRSWPWPLRSARVLAWLLRRARRFDVVYAAGLDALAVAGARVRGVPVVLRVVADPAWERGARLGRTESDFVAFQQRRPAQWSVRAMVALRDWTTRRASAVITPSAALAAHVRRWRDRDDVAVIPNGARSVPTPSRRPQPGLDVVFVGRLVPVKRVDVLIDAVARTPDVRLAVLGTGPEEDRLREVAQRASVQARVRFHGACAHEAVLQQVAAADALVLTSEHEGLPHAAIEALVNGTPVITTNRIGVDEIVQHDQNGIVVAPDVDAIAGALSRLRDAPEMREQLRAGARASADEWRFELVADRVEQLLLRVARRAPTAVFLGRGTVTIPLPREAEAKYAIHSRHLQTVLVSPGPRAGIIRARDARGVVLPQLRPHVLDAAVYYGVGSVVAVALAIRRGPVAIVCQSPYEAVPVHVLRRLLPRSSRPRVQVELHGDWRTATRLYGSRARRLLARPADAAASWSLRQADRVRVVSVVLEQLARDAGYDGPIDRFIAFSDYREFLDPPTSAPPDEPRALFVGVLERYKALDVLLDAWPSVVERLPSATLTIIGTGSMQRHLDARLETGEFGTSIRWLPPTSRRELRGLIDASTCLVLPSRSEGLARVVFETMARGRPVVASRVGGIEEILDDGREGRIVAPDDADALGAALVDVLGDRDRAAIMGERARTRVLARAPSSEYEAGVERMAAWIASG